MAITPVASQHMLPIRALLLVWQMVIMVIITIIPPPQRRLLTAPLRRITRPPITIPAVHPPRLPVASSNSSNLPRWSLHTPPLRHSHPLAMMGTRALVPIAQSLPWVILPMHPSRENATTSDPLIPDPHPRYEIRKKESSGTQGFACETTLHTHTTLPPTEPLTNLDTPHPLHNEQGLLNSPYPFGQSKNSYIIFSKSSPLGSPSRRLMCYRSASHLIFHIHFPPMNRIQTDSDVIAHTQHSRFFFWSSFSFSWFLATVS